MGLGGELGSAHVGNPDLDGAEALGAQAPAMVANALGERDRLGLRNSTHLAMLHVTPARGNNDRYETVTPAARLK